jgi:hypothetical protein
MLMAKSETRTIQGRHAFVNSDLQLASSREYDFAISISFGEKERQQGVSPRHCHCRI